MFCQTVQHHLLYWACCEFVFFFCSPSFLSAFLHPGLPRMPLFPGSLEVCWVCFHAQGEREEKRGQSRDYECVCMGVRVWECALNVCLCRIRKPGGGTKIYLTCWQSSTFQIHQQGKKKKIETKQKTTHPDISLPQNQHHLPSMEKKPSAGKNTSFFVMTVSSIRFDSDDIGKSEWITWGGFTKPL